MPKTYPVAIASDNRGLAGSLILPDNASRGTPTPAAVIIAGPGPVPLARRSRAGEKQWPLIWAEALAEAGIAALCYDQPGSGQSTGHYHDVDRNALHEDAIAATETLAAQPETAPGRLAAIAWEDGCGFALELAAAEKVQALVLLAPPYLTAEDRFKQEITALAARKGLSDRVVQYRVNQWRRQVEEMSAQVERGELTSAVEFGQATVTTNLARFLQNVNYDPAAVLPHVHVPVLILHGEDDNVIPPQESQLLADQLAAPHQRIVYKEAGHFLYTDRRVINDAIAWLQNLFAAGAGMDYSQQR